MYVLQLVVRLWFMVFPLLSISLFLLLLLLSSPSSLPPPTPHSNAYGDGAGLCNTLWGDSFVYTEEELDDTNRTCLSLWWPANETNPNDMAIRNIFGDQVDTVTAPVCASTSNAGRNEAAASVLLALVCMGVSALANSIL